MGKQVFEADGISLGFREIPNFVESREGMKPHHSYAYFCGRCGELWGWARHEGAAWTQCIWRLCRTHGDGRLSQAFPAHEPLGLAADWPRLALERELWIELDEFVQHA